MSKSAITRTIQAAGDAAFPLSSGPTFNGTPMGLASPSLNLAIEYALCAGPLSAIRTSIKAHLIAFISSKIRIAIAKHPEGASILSELFESLTGEKPWEK